MRLLLAATFMALGIACATRSKGPVKTQVVTFPEGAVVEFNGHRIGRAPAAVVLPQDANGRLTERAVLRAVPNTSQPTLYAQSRVLDPATRSDRVPDRIMIDLTLGGTNSVPAQVSAPSTHVESSSQTGRVSRPRPVDRGKPTQPVGIDRWNPGIY